MSPTDGKTHIPGRNVLYHGPDVLAPMPGVTCSINNPVNASKGICGIAGNLVGELKAPGVTKQVTSQNIVNS